jgi:DNA-directed RNA polymerase sigma subunit (sigma70/sigma32)
MRRLTRSNRSRRRLFVRSLTTLRDASKSGDLPANDQESRDYTSDELFFAEAQAQPFIEPEEERELSSRATAGDEDAANALVKSHLRLIIKLAREFRGRHTHAGLELSELISEGNVAAMRAIKTFDATKGRFATHATTWIKHELTANP